MATILPVRCGFSFKQAPIAFRVGAQVGEPRRRHPQCMACGVVGAYNHNQLFWGKLVEDCQNCRGRPVRFVRAGW